MPAPLLVIVPSRGRPANITRLAHAWQETCHGQADLLVAVDLDDPQLPGYDTVALQPWLHVHRGPRRRLGPTLNHLAVDYADKYRHIGFMGDDHAPRTAGWDTRIVAELDQLGTGIVYGNDLIHGAALPTAAFLSADIIAALGYMVPAGLVHLWIDNAWLALGRALDAIRYLPDVVIEHLHPIAGKAEWDPGYIECNNGALTEADHARYEHWVTDELMTDVAKIRQRQAVPS